MSGINNSIIGYFIMSGVNVSSIGYSVMRCRNDSSIGYSNMSAMKVIPTAKPRQKATSPMA